MNSNLKMTVERSKRRSHFLSLVFITKCFSKNLLRPIELSVNRGDVVSGLGPVHAEGHAGRVTVVVLVSYM